MPADLTPEQARRIVHHHLGDTSWVIHRGSPPSVFVSWEKVEHLATAPTVDAAAAECAAQLRLAGWTPTHERLEWEPNGNRLFLLTGRARFPVATYLLPTLDVLIHEAPSQPWHRAGTVAEMVEHIAGWVEYNLPYYLPPFPELSNA